MEYNRWEIAYADGSTPLATPDLPVDDQPNDGHDDQQQSRQADNKRNFGRLVVLLPLRVSSHPPNTYVISHQINKI
jgi:hypothetical protein